MKLVRWTLVIGCLIALPAAAVLGAQPADISPGERLQLTTRIEGLLAELDDGRFEVRDRAAAELAHMVADATPERQKTLAVALRRSLISAETSFEVRLQIARWLPQLPADRPEQPGDVAVAELDHLVGQLDAESYGVRLGAVSRLGWYLGRPELVIPLMLRLKERLADPHLAADYRALIEPLWKQARSAWLMSDPATWNLPPASDEQIARWINDLIRPAAVITPGETWSVHATAQRELLDILARDEAVPRVRAALSVAMATAPYEARPRLEHMLQWTQPAMVAEIWQSGIHYTIQHLLVDVPQQPEGALRVTHFDRIDERTAHCVSGNSLQTGDYPVGVAIPHPNPERSDQLAVFFHLTNLPTPRRRLWYEQYVELGEAQRLAAITRRTLQRVIDDRRVLSDGELRLLEYLDAGEISSAAAKYFLAIDDQPYTPVGQPGIGSPTSRHAQYCAVLASRGTAAAVSGVVEAVRARRILPPGEHTYNFAWLAVLGVCHRDEDRRLDPILAGLIERTDRLFPASEASGEYDLGATAAAVLLMRHGLEPQDYGLVAHSEPLIPEGKLTAYRFSSAEARSQVQRWWNQRSGGTPLP